MASPGDSLAAKTRSATTLSLVALGVVAGFAFVQAVRKGLWAADYLPLLLLSILSMAAVYLYAYTAMAFAAGLPRWRGFALTTAGILVPFAFGYYLAGYRGLWHLLKLRDHFSPAVLGIGATFLVLGFLLLKQVHRLWEVRQLVDAAAPRRR